MKLFLPIVPFVALALLPLLTPPAHAAPRATDIRLEAAIEDLKEMVQTRGGTRYDFMRLRELLLERAAEARGTFFTGCKVRTRFQQTADDLEGRAKRYQLRLEHVVDLEIQVIDARLNAAIEDLMEKARVRGATREDFQVAKDVLVQRARAMAGQLDAETVRARLTAALDDLEVLARGGVLEPDHFQRFWFALIDDRMDRALEALRVRAVAGQATRADYQRVADQIRDRAELAQEILPLPCP